MTSEEKQTPKWQLSREDTISAAVTGVAVGSSAAVMEGALIPVATIAMVSVPIIIVLSERANRKGQSEEKRERYARWSDITRIMATTGGITSALIGLARFFN